MIYLIYIFKNILKSWKAELEVLKEMREKFMGNSKRKVCTKKNNNNIKMHTIF